MYQTIPSLEKIKPCPHLEAIDLCMKFTDNPGVCDKKFNSSGIFRGHCALLAHVLAHLVTTWLYKFGCVHPNILFIKRDCLLLGENYLQLMLWALYLWFRRKNLDRPEVQEPDRAPLRNQTPLSTIIVVREKRLTNFGR